MDRINNNGYQKNANISMLLRQLWKNPGASRIDLARNLGIYKSTVTNIVALLLDRKVIIETEAKDSAPQGGRRPIGLSINPSFGAVLGIELQPEYFRAALLDFPGNIRFSRRGEPPAGSLADMVEGIVATIEPERIATGLPLLGICVGLPGIIDPASGRILRSAPFDLADFDAAQVAERFEVPVFFENDANSGAWGQLLERGGEGGDFLYLLMEHHERNPLTGKPRGIGVGLGVVIKDEVHYGATFSAGEFRSAEWKPGNRGQLGMGDEETERVMRDEGAYERYAEEVFRNLLPVMAVLDPARLVIGGDLSGRKELVRALVARTLEGRMPGRPGGRIQVDFSGLGDLDVAAGAAGMLIRRLVSVPELKDLESSMSLDWDIAFGLAARGGLGALRPGGKAQSRRKG